MYIREYVIEHAKQMHLDGNQRREEELAQEPPRIPVSQIGHCPRQALFSAAAYHPAHPFYREPTHPFDDYVIEVMECGNLWEHQTTKALRLGLGDKLHWEKGDPLLRVGNDVWSGHLDYVVEPCDQYPAGAIIEHKATNPVNFQRKNRLPYLFHCLQVLVYERLYRQQHGLSHVLPTWLYYRSWNNWAELEVWTDGRYVNWDGTLNGHDRNGEVEMEYSLDTQMAMAEGCWHAEALPPRYETPFIKAFTCARQDAKKRIAWPNCRYFGVCWPEKPQWTEPTGLEEWG